MPEKYSCQQLTRNTYTIIALSCTIFNLNLLINYIPYVYLYIRFDLLIDLYNLDDV